MASALLYNISQSNHRVECIYGRNPDAAKNLAQLYGLDVWTDYPSVPDGIDIVCLAVSDQAIVETASFFSSKANKYTLVHHSGATSISVLTNTADNCAVMWPIDSLSSSEHSLVETPLIIEASSVIAEQRISTLARSLSRDVRTANSTDRSRLHLGAVLANNFVNHLLVQCQDLARESGEDISLYQKILSTTVSRAIHGDAEVAQTGPAIRLDTDSMEKHLSLLKTDDLKALYTALSKSIIIRYHENHR